MPASSEYVSRNAYNINVGNLGPVAAFVGKAIYVPYRLGPREDLHGRHAAGPQRSILESKVLLHAK